MSIEQAPRFDLGPLTDQHTAFATVASHPAAFAAATIASTVVLLLALAAIALSAAADELLQSFRKSTEVLVFVRTGGSEEQIDTLRRSAAALPGVAEVRLTAASDSLKAVSDEGDLGIKQVPAILRIRAAPAAIHLGEWVAGIKALTKSSAIVDAVRVDEPWVVAVDAWTVRWGSLRTALSMAIALFLAALIGATWFLVARAMDVGSIIVGTYIVLMGLCIATVLCASTWLIGRSIDPDLARLPFEGEVGANLASALGFALVCGVAATALARSGR